MFRVITFVIPLCLNWGSSVKNYDDYFPLPLVSLLTSEMLELGFLGDLYFLVCALCWSHLRYLVAIDGRCFLIQVRAGAGSATRQVQQ